MEKLLLNKEHMRMAMLNHEATFKEQVHELHRLYQIQKILMRNIRNQKAQSKHQIDAEQRPISTVDYSSIMINITRGESDGGDKKSGLVIDESEIELTLGPTSHNKVKNADYYNNHRSGRRRRNNPPEEEESDCGPSYPETASLEYQMKKSNNNNNNNIANVEDELRLKHHPPWLFQVLSINMT